MRILTGLGSLFLFTMLGMSGCATVPGATAQEQAVTADELVERTLKDLYKQEPKTKEAIAKCVGYAVFNNKITKIPLVGAGRGYGVAIETKTGKNTYLKMVRFDIGGGWGARSVRPVIIFQDEAKFKDFITGEWSANAGAEAAAKVGDSGSAGGAGASEAGNDKGYTIHVLTDAGVSVTATVGVIRIAPIKLKD